MGADTVVVVVVLLRFTIPLFIPKYPLPAILAALVLDAADQTIFSWVTNDPLPGYQSYDKALDVYYLAIAYIATMRTWRDPVAFQLSRFLYLYRLVGVTLFELTHARWLLLVFPNTFEYFFDRLRGGAHTLEPAAHQRHGARRASAAFIWIVIKLPQEWWIHVAQLDFTEFMADHPWAWFVIGCRRAGVGDRPVGQPAQDPRRPTGRSRSRSTSTCRRSRSRCHAPPCSTRCSSRRSCSCRSSR